MYVHLGLIPLRLPMELGGPKDKLGFANFWPCLFEEGILGIRQYAFKILHTEKERVAYLLLSMPILYLIRAFSYYSSLL